MKSPFSPILLVILLPLLGSIVQALFGKRIIDTLGPANGKRIVGFLAVLPIAAAFGLGAYLTKQLDPTHIERLTFGDWITIQSISIPFEIQFDTLSATMVLIITGIGALIHLYATGYMAEEKEYSRFFTYMNLFIAFMLVLVLGGNLAILFIGWEGVGLCSYLLIGFWYKDIANAKAANKAFIVNRIGDWGLALGLFLIVAVFVGMGDRLPFQSDRLLSYDVIQANALALGSNRALTTAIALLLFVGACGKSAQFPLYLWLPDAMAGPTPVSALIHAATMVTSGVFLLNRLNIFFQMSQMASGIVAAVGAFTALFAAVVAFGQTDIKKVLAYSTVSQLGFMFVGCGAGAYWTGMFHVTTHAFFKALLFLGSGAVIHAMAHNQDMRSYGMLRKYLPITCATMFIGYLSIAGVPGLSGAVSKEAIIGAALSHEFALVSPYIAGKEQLIDLGMYSGFLALFVAMLTAFYMTRMTWLTFFGKEERWRQIPAHVEGHENPHHATHDAHVANEGHGNDINGFYYTDEEMTAREEVHEHHRELDKGHTPREVPPSMWFPLVILAILSAGGGWYLERYVDFKEWLYPDGRGLELIGRSEVPIAPLEPFHMTPNQIAIMAAAVGIFCGLLVYWRGLPTKEGWDIRKWHPFRLWAQKQFNYDSAMVGATVEGGADVGKLLWKGFDVGVIDRIVNGVGAGTMLFGSLFRKVQTGFVRSYALMMLLGGLALLAFAAFRLMGGGY